MAAELQRIVQKIVLRIGFLVVGRVRLIGHHVPVFFAEFGRDHHHRPCRILEFAIRINLFPEPQHVPDENVTQPTEHPKILILPSEELSVPENQMAFVHLQVIRADGVIRSDQIPGMEIYPIAFSVDGQGIRDPDVDGTIVENRSLLIHVVAI